MTISLGIYPIFRQTHMFTILYPQITCALVRKIHYPEESHVLIHPINEESFYSILFNSIPFILPLCSLLFSTPFTSTHKAPSGTTTSPPGSSKSLRPWVSSIPWRRWYDPSARAWSGSACRTGPTSARSHRGHEGVSENRLVPLHPMVNDH